MPGRPKAAKGRARGGMPATMPPWPRRPTLAADRALRVIGTLMVAPSSLARVTLLSCCKGEAVSSDIPWWNAFAPACKCCESTNALHLSPTCYDCVCMRSRVLSSCNTSAASWHKGCVVLAAHSNDLSALVQNAMMQSLSVLIGCQCLLMLCMALQGLSAGFLGGM